MSRLTAHSIDCPQCRASMDVQLYQTVNVSVDPALKERVLRRTINSVTCPKCGQEIEIGSNLLYHDMQRGFMVWLRLDKVRDAELTMPNKTLRIVHSYEALIEKIMICDAQLDDCLVEVLKILLWPQISGKKPSEYRGDELRFSGEKGENLMFDLLPEGTRAFSSSKAEALRMGPVVAKARAKAPSGSWHVVDRDFIAAHM